MARGHREHFFKKVVWPRIKTPKVLGWHSGGIPLPSWLRFGECQPAGLWDGVPTEIWFGAFLTSKSGCGWEHYCELLKLGLTSCTSAFRFELESCYYLKKWYCFCRFCRIGLAPVLIEITASPFTGFYARVCLCVFTYSIQWSYSVWFAGEVWQQMWGRTWDCLCLYSITILCLQGMWLYLDNHIFTKKCSKCYWKSCMRN